MKDLLAEPYRNGCLCISPDFWTDKHRQISYLGVSVGFVTADHKYVTFDLFCKQFEPITKTGENVLIVIFLVTNKFLLILSFTFFLQVLETEMKRFGIDDLTTTTIVCDQGANFLKAFRHLYPITCHGHKLNNVLKRSFFQHQKQPSISLSDFNENSSTSEEEEIDSALYTSSKPVKTKRSNIHTKVVEVPAMKMKLVDTPLAVQQLIKTIAECKSLAKYIKKVNV